MSDCKKCPCCGSALYQRSLGVPATCDVCCWLPTRANINLLPEPVRVYIMNLESLCDPAGIIHENTFLKDQVRQLEFKLQQCMDNQCQIVWQNSEVVGEEFGGTWQSVSSDTGDKIILYDADGAPSICLRLPLYRQETKP